MCINCCNNNQVVRIEPIPAAKKTSSESSSRHGADVSGFSNYSISSSRSASSKTSMSSSDRATALYQKVVEDAVAPDSTQPTSLAEVTAVLPAVPMPSIPEKGPSAALYREAVEAAVTADSTQPTSLAEVTAVLPAVPMPSIPEESPSAALYREAVEAAVTADSTQPTSLAEVTAVLPAVPMPSIPEESPSLDVRPVLLTWDRELYSGAVTDYPLERQEEIQEKRKGVNLACRSAMMESGKENGPICHPIVSGKLFRGGILSAQDLTQLRAKGITLVISVTDERYREDLDFGSFTCKEESSEPIKFVNVGKGLSGAEWDQPSFENLLANCQAHNIFDLIESEFQKKGAVLIHCNQGKVRSVLLETLVLLKFTDPSVSLEDIAALSNKCRPHGRAIVKKAEEIGLASWATENRADPSHPASLKA